MDNTTTINIALPPADAARDEDSADTSGYGTKLERGTGRPRIIRPAPGLAVQIVALSPGLRVEPAEEFHILPVDDVRGMAIEAFLSDRDGARRPAVPAPGEMRIIIGLLRQERPARLPERDGDALRSKV